MLYFNSFCLIGERQEPTLIGIMTKFWLFKARIHLQYAFAVVEILTFNFKDIMEMMIMTPVILKTP